ncbi:hypothetical protein ACFPK9_09325 [Rubritalea spongiae]|uniref:Uncharacterized protein n=1 Tax=Rubritalea spongiae TaxID=430797 RepID=A0ABW5E5B0_9BACT
MALAGEGCFTTVKFTNHLRTNIEVIQQFLKVKVRVENPESDALVLSIQMTEAV